MKTFENFRKRKWKRFKKVKKNENKVKKNLLKPIETSVNELVYNELRAYGGCLGTERR